MQGEEKQVASCFAWSESSAVFPQVVVAALERWETQQPDSLTAVLPRLMPLFSPLLSDLSSTATLAGADADEVR